MPHLHTLALLFVSACVAVSCGGDSPTQPLPTDTSQDTPEEVEVGEADTPNMAVDVPEDPPDTTSDMSTDPLDDPVDDTNDANPDTEDALEIVCPDGDDPRFTYLEETTEDCSISGFQCNDFGWTAVNIPGCGCGCAAADNVCPDADDAGVVYLSDSVEACARVTLSCDSGMVPFDGSCGCGCVEETRICPNPAVDGVDYASESPQDCQELAFLCLPGQAVFSSVCGCGCVDLELDECPFPPPPLAQYWGDATGCARAGLSGPCEDGGEWFDNECGCGCLNAPPVCPNPQDPRVRYNAGDPDECGPFVEACPEDSFNGPCGCGCMGECPVPEDPRVFYAGSSLEECEVLRIECAEGWRGFREECGCGCLGPENLRCETEKFIGRSVDAARLQLGRECEVMLVCSPAPAYALEAAVSGFEDATCTTEAASGCPEGSMSSCEVYLGDVESHEVVRACRISTLSHVSALSCRSAAAD